MHEVRLLLRSKLSRTPKHAWRYGSWIERKKHRMMSGSKAPDFDTYGLFRATHSHFSAPLRSVLDMCHWHIAPYPIFAYRGIIIPLLCSYRGRS